MEAFNKTSSSGHLASQKKEFAWTTGLSYLSISESMMTPTEPPVIRITFTISHFFPTKCTLTVSAHFAKCHCERSRPFRLSEINLLMLYVEDNIEYCPKSKGTAVAHWLRCCATNRKVAGSIPAGVIGIFH